ncbi:hypothetical protein ACEPAH_1502 [Sanghuangporus vaninii]
MNHIKKVRERHKTRLQEPSQGKWNCRFPIQITQEIFKHFLTTFIVERYFRKQEIPMKGRINRAQPFFRNLAGSCYELYQVATPILYEEIYLSSSDALASLAKAVTKYPHLQPMVRYLHYSNSMFRYGQIKVSHLDACNIERIHLVCGNLISLSVQRPHDIPYSEEEIIRPTGLGAIGLENLTHLEIDLPRGMPFCTEPILSSGLKFPALRDLIVNVGHCKTSPEHVDTHDVREHLMQWPQMPALARLCIKNLHVMDGCFSFPEHSNNIHVIELLGGDYSSVKTFFYRDIWRYAHSLESLVITATDVAADEHLPFKLRHFSGLTEVCVPLLAFARWYKCKMPCDIRRFVVSGDPAKKFVENDERLLQVVNERLTRFLELAGRGGDYYDLEYVRLIIASQWSLRGNLFADARRAADRAFVELKFGYCIPEEGEFLFAFMKRTRNNHDC